MMKITKMFWVGYRERRVAAQMMRVASVNINSKQWNVNEKRKTKTIKEKPHKLRVILLFVLSFTWALLHTNSFCIQLSLREHEQIWRRRDKNVFYCCFFCCCWCFDCIKSVRVRACMCFELCSGRNNSDFPLFVGFPFLSFKNSYRVFFLIKRRKTRYE